MNPIPAPPTALSTPPTPTPESPDQSPIYDEWPIIFVFAANC